MSKLWRSKSLGSIKYSKKILNVHFSQMLKNIHLSWLLLDLWRINVNNFINKQDTSRKKKSKDLPLLDKLERISKLSHVIKVYLREIKSKR